jgi:hypothetical protein
MINDRNKGLAVLATLISGLVLTVPLAQAANPDSDGDGLTASEEKALKTNPKKADSDKDGLSDGVEVHLSGSSPRDKDSDNDTLSDNREVTLGTNPSDRDSDDDGLRDGQEIKKGTDPNDGDTDNDGKSDSKDGKPGHLSESGETEIKGNVTNLDPGACTFNLDTSATLSFDASGATIEGGASCADLAGKFVEVEGQVADNVMKVRKVEFEDVEFDSDGDGQCWNDDDSDGSDDDEDEDKGGNDD